MSGPRATRAAVRRTCTTASIGAAVPRIRIRGWRDDPSRHYVSGAAVVYGVPNTMNVSMSVRVPVAAAAFVASTVTWIVWTPAGRVRTYMTRRGSEPAL